MEGDLRYGTKVGLSGRNCRHESDTLGWGRASDDAKSFTPYISIIYALFCGTSRFGRHPWGWAFVLRNLM